MFAAVPPTPDANSESDEEYYCEVDYNNDQPCAACSSAGYEPRYGEWDTMPCSVCKIPLCAGGTTLGCADDDDCGGCFCKGCDERMCADHTDWCEACREELGYIQEPYCLNCMYECPYCEVMSCAEHKDVHRCPMMQQAEEEGEGQGEGEGEGSAPQSP